MARVQGAITERGFVTTRIVAPPQDIGTGVLLLKIIPGRVGDVSLSDDSGKYICLYPLVPLRKGRLFSIRDVEQGLENLRRVPTVAADAKLFPGKNEGESGIEVTRKQGRPVRVLLSSDDSGSEYTGKYQGTATLFLDNTLGLSDMLSVSAGRDLAGGDRRRGTRNYSVYYSIPWTYWQLSFYHNNHDYRQQVAGYATTYTYSGESQNTSLELSRTMLRTSRGKTSAFVGGFLNRSRNYIDDTELEIQRRRLAGWEIGLSHRQHLGSAVFDADFRYKHGRGAFGAIRAPEEAVARGRRGRGFLP